MEAVRTLHASGTSFSPYGKSTKVPAARSSAVPQSRSRFHQALLRNERPIFSKTVSEMPPCFIMARITARAKSLPDFPLLVQSGRRGMAERLVTVDRMTPMLLPEDMRDWVSEDDLVPFVTETVERMNLRRFRVNVRGTGDAQYPPSMRLSLLIYCCASGLFSRRRSRRRRGGTLPLREPPSGP